MRFFRLLKFLLARWDNPADRFRAIYRGNLWGDDESRSGPGSRRDSAAVAHTLTALDQLSERLGFRSLADLPCGDCNWIGTFLQAHPEIDYLGYDVVPDIVRSNRQRLPYRFEVLDVTRDVPARADLVLSKDLFNHLTDAEVFAAIRNVVRSGSSWLLASNNFGWANRKLSRFSMASSRHLDLTAPPFNLPPPQWTLSYLGLWDLSVLREWLKAANGEAPTSSPERRD